MKLRLWLGLVTIALAAFLCFAYPMYVIRHFRAQGSSALAAALIVRRFGPFIAVACTALSIALAWALRWKPLAIAAAVVTCAFAVLARVNIYEKMFHPLGAPAFTDIASANVDADDMLITVRVGGAARAYPIRNMGYHHIVNDRVGGVPIVATY
jgi:hypothetical protein